MVKNLCRYVPSVPYHRARAEDHDLIDHVTVVLWNSLLVVVLVCSAVFIVYIYVVVDLERFIHFIVTRLAS